MQDYERFLIIATFIYDYCSHGLCHNCCVFGVVYSKTVQQSRRRRENLYTKVVRVIDLTRFESRASTLIGLVGCIEHQIFQIFGVPLATILAEVVPRPLLSSALWETAKVEHHQLYLYSTETERCTQSCYDRTTSSQTPVLSPSWHSTREWSHQRLRHTLQLCRFILSMAERCYVRVPHLPRTPGLGQPRFTLTQPCWRRPVYVNPGLSFVPRSNISSFR